MEPNQPQNNQPQAISSEPPKPVTPVAAATPPPQIPSHCEPDKPHAPHAHFLLLCLLIAVVLFSSMIVLNYQSQQADLEAASTPVIIKKTPKTVNKVRILPTPASVKKSSTNSATTLEEKDLDKIDLGSVDTDLQSINKDLQGL